MYGEGDRKLSEKELKEKIEYLEEMLNVILKYKNGGLAFSPNRSQMYVKENNSTIVKVFDLLELRRPSTAIFNGESFDTQTT